MNRVQRRTYDIWKYQEYVFVFFDELLDKPENRIVIEELGGVPIVIRNVPITEYVQQVDDATNIMSVSVTFGHWTWRFFASPYRFYGTTDPDIFEVHSYYKGEYIARTMLSIVDNKICEINYRDNVKLITTVVGTIRRRVQKVLSAAETYLANQAEYDRLKVLMDIKPPRKRK